MPDPATWLSTVDDVRALRAKLHAQKKKLVFTNGVFDLLHVGHVRYLRQARELGDALVVALNSDASVRALKGPSRPIHPQDDRAEILRALESVDQVVVFEEPRVTKLIETIQPHVYTKGGDYTVESLNPEERAALAAVGADIRILPLVHGRSTTAALKRLSAGEDAKTSTRSSNKLRLGILGSGQGTNFDAILRAISDGILDAEISVVISDIADSPILRKAQAAGLTAIHVNPGSNTRKLAAHAQKEIRDHLNRHHAQVVVLTGFMRVLKEPLLSEFRDRIVNIHPSLLPKFKGVAAWKQALQAGETETGCTVHLVSEDLDSGRILGQTRVPILPDDTVDGLFARIQVEEHKLLPRVLSEWRQLGLPLGN
jgi:formyltetrahydrofolate-dependent phosphoribosylglycinamide formyltransferase